MPTAKPSAYRWPPRNISDEPMPTAWPSAYRRQLSWALPMPRAIYTPRVAVGVFSLRRGHFIRRRPLQWAGLLTLYADGPDKLPSAYWMAVGVCVLSCSARVPVIPSFSLLRRKDPLPLCRAMNNELQVAGGRRLPQARFGRAAQKS